MQSFLNVPMLGCLILLMGEGLLNHGVYIQKKAKPKPKPLSPTPYTLNRIFQTLIPITPSPEPETLIFQTPKPKTLNLGEGQRAQYPLIKEYGLNYTGLHNMI